MRCFTFMVACFCSVSLTLAQIQPVVTGNQGEGNVDWSQRFILATGIGASNPALPASAQRPAAIRAAQQIALRNVLETVKGIYLNSSTTVKNFMIDNDVVSSSVSGFLKGFEQDGRTRYMEDGTVEITMKVPLDGIGGLGEKILGGSISELPSITQFEGKKAQNQIAYTGLIINCKGLAVKPALSPRVLDETGVEVYGSAYISREWAIKNGVVAYSKDVNAALKLVDRIGKTPGQIKAMKAFGENSTDVVISNVDAESIRSAASNLKFLSECRVLFIID